LEILTQLSIYFIIPGIFLSGIVLTSFSDSDLGGPKEIIIEIEPPQEEFEDNSKEQEKEQPTPEAKNSGGENGNIYTSYVTGSGYARNGEAILISTPEGIKLNEKLIDQQELEELQILHGEEFWKKIDRLTYDHYGLANALSNPNSENSYFVKGGKYSENPNSNLDYYLLERGYDPNDLSNVPNNVFTPLKYDLARAVMQKLQDSNANNLDITKFKESNLEVLSPNAFSMSEEDQNVMYHNDVENRAMTMLKDTLPSISGSSDSDSESITSQNNDNIMNQELDEIKSMPEFGANGSQEEQKSKKHPTPKLNEELFQNTEHLKDMISRDNFKPNYDTKTEIIFPFVEVILSIIIFSISTIIGLIVFKKLKNKPKQVITPLITSSTFDYVQETHIMLKSANILYQSKQIKDAYEQFSHAIRFYYSCHYDMKREVTTFEILREVEENQKSDYKTVYNCLVLCGIVEFAKHDERKNDFIDCVSAFSEIIGIPNGINTNGAPS